MRQDLGENYPEGKILRHTWMEETQTLLIAVDNLTIPALWTQWDCRNGFQSTLFISSTREQFYRRWHDSIEAEAGHDRIWEKILAGKGWNRDWEGILYEKETQRGQHRPSEGKPADRQ